MPLAQTHVHLQRRPRECRPHRKGACKQSGSDGAYSAPAGGQQCWMRFTVYASSVLLAAAMQVATQAHAHVLRWASKQQSDMGAWKSGPRWEEEHARAQVVMSIHIHPVRSTVVHTWGGKHCARAAAASAHGPVVELQGCVGQAQGVVWSECRSGNQTLWVEMRKNGVNGQPLWRAAACWHPCQELRA